MTIPGPVRGIVCAALAGLCLPGALVAQSNEYKLNPGQGGTAEQPAWTQIAAPSAGTDEAVIAEARRALAENRPGNARSTLDSWIEANRRGTSPLLPEAYLLRADAKTADGNEYKALYDYETVIKDYSASPQYVTAVERELEIGIRYLEGLNYKKWGMRIWGARGIGEELLIRVQERMPGSAVAERAGMELADYYYRRRNLDLSGEAYDLFLQNYPKSKDANKAMRRRVYSAVGQYKGPAYDGASLLDAQVLIRRYSALYPAEAAQAGLDDALLTRLDESAAVELLENARWYLKQGDEASARYTLVRLVEKHPRTAASDRAAEILDRNGWVLAATPPAKPEADAGAPGPTPSPAPKPKPAVTRQPTPAPTQPPVAKPAPPPVTPTQEPVRPAPVEPEPPAVAPPPPTPPPAPAPPAATPTQPKPGFTPGKPVRKPKPGGER